jgi:CubicO group peptidase (beta-lactamase class C family)
MAVQGTCDPKFQEVRQEFERNFQERGEVGASVCVTVQEQTVVDLWGGQANAGSNTPWKEDTVSVVFSSTKGATALCAHMLASRGQLDLDAPVATYWPEFAQSGKENIPVKMLLSHQAGLPAVRETLPDGAYADWDLIVNALAKEEPFWEPGTRNGYHALTFGWLVGEVVRRVSGKSLGTFFKDEVAGPLGLDFWIGLPEDKESQVAPMIAAEPNPESPFFREIATPGSMQSIVLLNMGGYMGAEPQFDTRAAHAAEIGGAGGVTNGRGLAGMYEPLALGGKKDSVELVNPETLARMGRVASSTGKDAVLVMPTRFALGYMKTMDNRKEPAGVQDSVLVSEAAFGHVGAGGSFGFADPPAAMSFGYTMNRMGPGAALNDRGQNLVDAVYRALGYQSNASGAWK